MPCRVPKTRPGTCSLPSTRGYRHDPAAYVKNIKVWGLGCAPARAQQGLVEDVRAVGAGQHDDALGRRKAVHLDQQLVQRVLALVVAAGEPAAPARAPDRVDLVCARKGLPSGRSCCSCQQASLWNALYHLGQAYQPQLHATFRVMLNILQAIGT